MSDTSSSRSERLKRISLGAKIATAFEDNLSHEDESAKLFAERAERVQKLSITAKVAHAFEEGKDGGHVPGLNARGLYTMPPGYDDEDDDSATGGGSRSGGGRGRAYIGDGRYVDTSQADEDAITAPAVSGGKGLQSGNPFDGGFGRLSPTSADDNSAAGGGPGRMSGPNGVTEGTMTEPSYLDKARPWRGPGSWAAEEPKGGGYHGKNAMASFLDKYRPPDAERGWGPPDGRMGGYPRGHPGGRGPRDDTSFVSGPGPWGGKSGAWGAGSPGPWSGMGGSGYYGPGGWNYKSSLDGWAPIPPDDYSPLSHAGVPRSSYPQDSSVAFGTHWNLNPRTLDEFAMQMDGMFRTLATGVDYTNEKLSGKISRTDLRFDELEYDSRPSFAQDYGPPLPDVYSSYKALSSIPRVRAPQRPESINHRFNLYAK